MERSHLRERRCDCESRWHVPSRLVAYARSICRRRWQVRLGVHSASKLVVLVAGSTRAAYALAPARATLECSPST